MRRLLALMLLPACVVAQAAEWKESAQLAELFRQEGVRGTFIVHGVAADTRYVPYTFALNLGIPDNATGARRVPLGKASLSALGLLQGD